MPHYEIFHTCSISPAQRQQLATAITNLHCSTFSAPSIFVNITFHYYSDNHNDQVQNYSRTMFVGGKETSTNYIIGHLRTRTHLPNNRPLLNTLTLHLRSLWNDVLHPAKPGSLDDQQALHNIFLMGDIAAGAEQGFVLPLAGEDAQWVEEHRAEFERRAEGGEGSMKALLEEVGRGLGSGSGSVALEGK